MDTAINPDSFLVTTTSTADADNSHVTSFIRLTNDFCCDKVISLLQEVKVCIHVIQSVVFSPSHGMLGVRDSSAWSSNLLQLYQLLHIRNHNVHCTIDPDLCPEIIMLADRSQGL